MSALQVPTDPVSLYYDQLTQLEGLEYLLRFLWVDRESSWYLSVYDQDENPIAVGIRIVVNWPLLRRFTDPRIPPGMLMAVDTSGDNQEIQVPSDLGSRVLLVYITSDSLSTDGLAALVA